MGQENPKARTRRRNDCCLACLRLRIDHFNCWMQSHHLRSVCTSTHHQHTSCRPRPSWVQVGADAATDTACTSPGATMHHPNLRSTSVIDKEAQLMFCSRNCALCKLQVVASSGGGVHVYVRGRCRYGVHYTDKKTYI